MMKNIHPRKYEKENFIKFLHKNNVNCAIINKFAELPETIEHNKNTYKLYINSTWYSAGKTFYNFELNYYCEDLIEYLFNSKVFNDIEISINNLLCDIMNLKQKGSC